MIQVQPDVAARALIGRIQTAINQHDLDALTECFTSDYQSTFPAHPDRAFQGHEQMRKNWSVIFNAAADLEAEVVRYAVAGDTVWAEWEWQGRRADGAQAVFRGVTIHGVQHDRTAWVRMYMEPVQPGAGADAAVRQAWRGETG